MTEPRKLSPPEALGCNLRRLAGRGVRLAVASAVLAAVAVGTPGRRPTKAAEAAAPGGDVTVTAQAETQPGLGNADDPAIWVNPADPSTSVVIGTDKNRGLGLYDLNGGDIAFLAAGATNNVDLRDGFPLGGSTVSLVVAADDNASSLRTYRLDPANRSLVDVAARPLTVGVKAHGLCLYHSPRSGKLYAFPNDPQGRTEQWELFDDGTGKVDARSVRGPWMVGTGSVEGCVADDELGQLYVSEERGGIWKFAAEPSDSPSNPVHVDGTGPGSHLVADAEGLAIIPGPSATGYLVASSQGDNAFALYRRGPTNEFVGRFRVGPGAVDGCEDTDGIEVRTEALGPQFPNGLFVCQDGRNDSGKTNFKLVPLERILQAYPLAAAAPGSTSQSLRLAPPIIGGHELQASASITTRQRTTVMTVSSPREIPTTVIRMMARDRRWSLRSVTYERRRPIHGGGMRSTRYTHRSCTTPLMV